MPDQTTAAAQAVATYYNADMRFMFIYGSDDTIFPPTTSQNMDNNILAKLGASSAIKISVIEQGNGHVVTSNGLANMVRFINGADTYDSSTEVAGGGGKGDDKGGDKSTDTKDEKSGDEDYWCETFGYNCPTTTTKDDKVDDGSPSWYKTAEDYVTPEGSKVLLGPMVSTMLLAALQYI